MPVTAEEMKGCRLQREELSQRRLQREGLKYRLQLQEIKGCRLQREKFVDAGCSAKDLSGPVTAEWLKAAGCSARLGRCWMQRDGQLETMVKKMVKLETMVKTEARSWKSKSSKGEG